VVYASVNLKVGCYVMKTNPMGCKLTCVYIGVFQPFKWSGTLCNSFDCSLNPCLLGRGLLRPEGPKFETEGRQWERWKGVLGAGGDQLGSLGSTVSSPSGSGRAPTVNTFWTY